MMKKDQISKFRIVHPVLFCICFFIFSTNFVQAQVVIKGVENIVVDDGVVIYNDSYISNSLEKENENRDHFIKISDQIYVAHGAKIIELDSPENHSSKISSVEKSETKNKAETTEPKERKDIATNKESSVRDQAILSRLDDSSNFQSNSRKIGSFAIASSGSYQSKKKYCNQ